MPLDMAETEAWLIALGHDQTASLCPWVELTRSTSDYPSRKAGSARALLSGALEPTPRLVDQLFRCDGCGRCQHLHCAGNEGALSEVLFRARAAIVDRKLSPECDDLLALWNEHGNTYGPLGSAIERLGPGDSRASTLFVPGAALLARDQLAAGAAFTLLRQVSDDGARFDADFLDSAWALKELGLREMYETEAERLRTFIRDGGFRAIVAATPKETIGLAHLVVDLPVDVKYAGSVVAESISVSMLKPDPVDQSQRLAIHPSEYLLHHLNCYHEVIAGIQDWLGMSLIVESGVKEKAWPAAVERPQIRAQPELTKGMARRRADQIIAFAGAGKVTVLTVDPFSKTALSAALPDAFEVVDFMQFVAGHLPGAGAQ